MRERILNIIEIVVKHILMTKEVVFNENEVIEYLLSEGYNLDEINTAFSWIREIIGHQRLTPPSRKLKKSTGIRGIRLLSPEEKMNLGPEAHGFLIRLKELGFIDDDIQEEIIEKAMYLSDGEIGREEIKTIVALVIMNRSGAEWSDDINRFFSDEWKSSLN
jgi:Smg protein